jgi:cytochrome P450
VLDPESHEFLADPHAVYDALRPADLVADAIGLSAISYAACDAAFHDPSLVPGIDPLLERLGIGALWGDAEHTLTDSEGPNHARLRRALTPWFTPKRMAELRQRTRALVSSLVDVAEPGKPFDVMAGLARIVPARLFCWMLGAPDDDDALLAEWSKALILVFTAEPAMVDVVRAAKVDIANYARELMDHKRRHPDDALAAVLATTGELTADDRTGLLEELLSAAVDNTANTTGCAFHALATHPDAWAVAHRGTDIATAVEECGRWEPAIRHTIKYATSDTVLLGTPIASGSFVTLRVAAAHRDPAVFPDPHSFDVTRPLPKPQLAFGAGRHYCLGAALARMEVQEMVSAVTKRWRAVAVGDGATMEIAANGHVHCLPLEVEP